MAEASPNNKGKLVGLGLGGVVVVGAIAYVLLRPHAAVMVTPFSKYFPAKTALYMEVTPSDKLASRVLQGVDRLWSESKQPGAHSDVNIDAVFQKDFKPAMSAGIWMSGAETAQADPSATTKPLPIDPPAAVDGPVEHPMVAADAKQEQPVYLTVVALKDGVTLETVSKDMKITMDNFTQVKEGGVTMLVGKSGRLPVIAVSGSDFLMAPTVPALKEALALSKTADKSLLSNAMVKDGLSLLPATRQGTFLTQAAEFQKIADSRPTATSPQAMLVKKLQANMQTVVPLTIGSIAIDQDQFLRFDSFSPTHFDLIKDESLRKDLQGAMMGQTNLNAADMLPKETLAYGSIFGLGKYYDVYLNHLATAPEKQSVENVQNQLKMMGLDLRKNIVSLLDDQATVGVVAKTGGPDVLVFLNGTPDTRKALDQFGLLASQMTRGFLTNEKVDDKHDIKVLESPVLPFKAGFSSVRPDTEVLGTPEGIQKVYSVANKKTPSLAQADLYKELSADLPSQATGVFFMDFTQGFAFMDDLARRTPSMQSGLAKMKLALGGIEGIAGGGTAQGDSMLKGHMVIKLTKEAAASAAR